MQKNHLTSEEAAEFLGVSKATLYSYVSRGMLRSEPTEAGTRRRSYSLAELQRLKHRHSYRSDPERAAEEVIEFGNPILATSISQITPSSHSYRGVSSAQLARDHLFEEVAEFLWTGQLSGSHDAWTLPLDEEVLRSLPDLPVMAQIQCLLPVLENSDLNAFSNKPAVLVPSAVRIMTYMLRLSSGLQFEDSVSATLGKAWNCDPRVLNSLLVVIADHELNIATFTARCVASAGSNIYQAALAGLAALQGYKHLQGQVGEAMDFFREVLNHGDAEPVIRNWLKRSGKVPGFHNPYRRLYDGRDPRVSALLELHVDSEHYALLQDTVRLAEAATGEHARVDFALACAEPLLALPAGSIYSLIGLGRMAGMLAHVFEQYASDRVIRPRARYVPS